MAHNTRIALPTALGLLQRVLPVGPQLLEALPATAQASHDAAGVGSVGQTPARVQRRHRGCPFSQPPHQGFCSLTSPATAAAQHGSKAAQDCYSCNLRLRRGTFACHGCDKLQPADSSLNYFELLGMPNLHFDLDLVELDRQYKQRQWRVHPDKVVSRPAEEQDHAAQQASLINHAYTVLRTPLFRANYILTQHGVQAADSFEGTIDDKELLMEVLETREQVEETQDEAELRALLTRNRAQQAGLQAQLSAAFKARELAQALQLTTQLTYLVRLEEEMVLKLPDIG